MNVLRYTLGGKGSIFEEDIPNILLRLLPMSKDEDGVLTPTTISHTEWWDKARTNPTKTDRIGSKATFQKYVNRLVDAKLVIQEATGYKRSPISFHWDRRKEKYDLEGWVEALETEEGLRHSFQLAFEFTLKAYVEMLRGLTTIVDESAARKYLELFFQSRLVDAPLAFLAQSIYANRKKVPLDSLQTMIMRVSPGSRVLGEL